MTYVCPVRMTPTDLWIGGKADLESALIKSEYYEGIKPGNIAKQIRKVEQAKIAVEGTFM